jgi:hypothetical protein
MDNPMDYPLIDIMHDWVKNHMPGYDESAFMAAVERQSQLFENSGGIIDHEIIIENNFIVKSKLNTTLSSADEFPIDSESDMYYRAFLTWSGWDVPGSFTGQNQDGSIVNSQIFY